MRAEEFQEERVELAGWPVNLMTYRIGETYYCQADNVSPGARLARISASTKEEAVRQAVAKAEEMLARTHRRPV